MAKRPHLRSDHVATKVKDGGVVLGDDYKNFVARIPAAVQKEVALFCAEHDMDRSCLFLKAFELLKDHYGEK